MILAGEPLCLGTGYLVTLATGYGSRLPHLLRGTDPHPLFFRRRPSGTPSRRRLAFTPLTERSVRPAASPTDNVRTRRSSSAVHGLVPGTIVPRARCVSDIFRRGLPLLAAAILSRLTGLPVTARLSLDGFQGYFFRGSSSGFTYSTFHGPSP